jgi:hypothetical protein
MERAKMSEADVVKMSEADVAKVLGALYHAADELHTSTDGWICGEDEDGNIVPCEVCEAIAVMERA